MIGEGVMGVDVMFGYIGCYLSSFVKNELVMKGFLFLKL